jgi:hypothetical protein
MLICFVLHFAFYVQGDIFQRPASGFLARHNSELPNGLSNQ